MVYHTVLERFVNDTRELQTQLGWLSEDDVYFLESFDINVFDEGMGTLEGRASLFLRLSDYLQACLEGRQGFSPSRFSTEFLALVGPFSHEPAVAEFFARVQQALAVR
jgi:hypothetical protein